MKTVLVTDSLFIDDEHVNQLNQAGFKVERLDKTIATEQDLKSAIKGKTGYIVGGLEKVTGNVIKAADKLQAIIYTGTAWELAIVGSETAKQKGIKIAAAPHLNAEAVADWTLSASLAMNRNLFNGLSNRQIREVSQLHIGIVGLGTIGSLLAEKYSVLGANVSYWSRSSRNDKYNYCELNELLTNSDIVLITTTAAVGEGWFGSDRMALMKKGALLGSVTHGIVDEEALLSELQDNRMRAFFDWTPQNIAYSMLDRNVFYGSVLSAAYNTVTANKAISESAVNSIINLLSSGIDKNRVL